MVVVWDVAVVLEVVGRPLHHTLRESHLIHPLLHTPVAWPSEAGQGGAIGSRKDAKTQRGGDPFCVAPGDEVGGDAQFVFCELHIKR